jgi:hypothetical protein
VAPIDIEQQPTIGSQLLHFAVVGSLVFGSIFFACWLLIFTSVTVTHSFIALFTAAEATSQIALVQGLCWSLIFGAWVGFLTAAVHRIVSRIGL